MENIKEVQEMAKVDLMKKGVLIGVGLAAYAQEQAERLAKELIRKGKINQKDGIKLVSKIKKEAEKHGKTVSRLAETELRRVLQAAECKGAKRMGMTCGKGSKRKKR